MLINGLNWNIYFIDIQMPYILMTSFLRYYISSYFLFISLSLKYCFWILITDVDFVVTKKHQKSSWIRYILSHKSHSGEELSGVGGLKISLDRLNRPSNDTPADPEASSSDALSRGGLCVALTNVLLNLWWSRSPCLAFGDAVSRGADARIGLSSYILGFWNTWN